MEYPQTFLHGCNRSCKSEYLSNNFVYSNQNGEIYCTYCTLFLTEEKQNLKSFVNSGQNELIELIRKSTVDMSL